MYSHPSIPAKRQFGGHKAMPKKRGRKSDRDKFEMRQGDLFPAAKLAARVVR